jgi:hypothetical protein
MERQTSGRVCRATIGHVYRVIALFRSLLDHVCRVTDAEGAERRTRLSPATDAGSRSVGRV